MDTAQPFAAAETDPNAQLANAANAFKAFMAEPSAQARDEQGRFASPEAEAEPEIEEGVEPEAVEGEATEDEPEAADEPAQPMPPSWPADQAEQWSALPAETQAFLAEREAERERAVNAKFQESANARKAAEATAQEAATNRQKYADMLETLVGVFQPAEPDPRAFGAGTGQFNQEAYALAMAEYRESQGVIAQLVQQRDALIQEVQAEESRKFEEWKQSVESEWAPKLLAEVPEIADPVRADATVRSLVSYALANGIPEDTFTPENQTRITSPELLLIWKAMKYDELKTKGAQPKPKPSPAVKPGVSSPRSAQVHAQRSRDFQRLSNEGSIEAGAAVFKHFLKR